MNPPFPPIPYDATPDALFHPEYRAPLRMTGWAPDAIAAECSRLAYVRFETGQPQQQTIADAVATAGYRGCTWFKPANPADDRWDARGFGAVSDAGAVIAFRGTQPDSARNILADFRIGRTAWQQGGLVHVGFADALLSILPQIEAWLQTIQPASLTITGHSLGAALATLLASLRPDATLITFGSPRVGDQAFAALFAGRQARRYVDCTDLVTDLPPPLGYAHLADLCYIDHQGVLRDATDAGLSIVADRLRGEAAFAASAINPANVHLRGLADHAPINYVSAILGVRTGP